MTLGTLFDLSLTCRRNEAALEFGGGTLTFGEVDRRANRMARLLASRGVKKGDRLCVYLANRIEMIDLYLACVKTGVIFVPVNILYREREIRHILRDAEPAAVAAAGELPADAAVPVWQAEELAAKAAEHPDTRPAADLDGDSPAALIYTSGTTGTAKGAILTHHNFAANAVNLITCWQLTSADRLLLALPLFHTHALGNGLHTWLMAGYRMRLLERFDHRTAAEEFLEFQPTVFFGVPAMYVRLLDIPPETARKIGAAARLFVSGSAPLPPQVLEEFRARFGHTILERYGMTETCMNLSNPYAGERRAGTVGLPLPGVSCKIVEGELYVRGPNVCAGYWRREKATREAFEGGWFRTGDLAERSEDGYYTLKGRKSDLIISGGFNIYPREIEELLLEQAGVADAAVAAQPDRVRGEVPVAYLVAKPGAVLDTGRIEQVCRASLASFKVPRAFIAVEGLPRTALGKVQKHLLPKPGGE
jgi:malonyl-CoA/methylmalonyl-CoA synthetase